MGEANAFPDNSYSSSLGELSRSSQGTSCSSSDLVDDDASSSPTITFSSNSSSSHSFSTYKNDNGDRGGGGPLCELSELMTHLPIKRGLSWHYAGKSQSFTSLASARSLEDLMKKDNPCAKRLKVCRGLEGGSSPESRSRRSFSYGPNTAAKAAMPEKRSPFLGTTTSSSSLGKRCTSIHSRPPIPIVRTF